MSGFERILARVGGDALRDYCSSAIEDELKTVKCKMETCLAAVEAALDVQTVIRELNVSLSETNVATFRAIRGEYQRFSDDLDAFVQEQKKLPVAKPTASPTASSASRSGANHVEAADSDSAAQPASERLANVIAKMQRRLAKKHSDHSHSWITKNITTLSTVASIVTSFAPTKAQQSDVVLALDHFISALLLSPRATNADLTLLEATLHQFTSAPTELAEFTQSSRSMVLSKMGRSEKHHQSQGVPAVGAPTFNSDNSHATTRDDATAIKKRKRDGAAEGNGDGEVSIKLEKRRQHESAEYPQPQHVDHSTPTTAYDVYVTELPWGVMQHDVEAYFSAAGQLQSVRMPTMDDGSTVGVAMMRFVTVDGQHAALRMDGYHFQGKSIRVKLPGGN